jgi:hypothetical protein
MGSTDTGANFTVGKIVSLKLRFNGAKGVRRLEKLGMWRQGWRETWTLGFLAMPS